MLPVAVAPEEAPLWVAETEAMSAKRAVLWKVVHSE